MQYRTFIRAGCALSIIAVLAVALASAFPITATAAEDGTELPIGAPGWQPNARSFLFHVPFFRQQHSLSCEVASLRSALAGVGVRVTEYELWNSLRKDTTGKRVVDGVIVWGNPNWGYVGNVDGRMPSTGYGVHAPPLAMLAERYAEVSEIDVRDPHAIDRALSRRHPVVAWSAIGSDPHGMVWRTPFGRWINAAMYEHTVVIIGYRGSPDAMEGVYVLDPLSSIRYETWDEFLHRTSFFEPVALEIAPK
jgi:uncharacterized protein YvpB